MSEIQMHHRGEPCARCNLPTATPAAWRELAGGEGECLCWGGATCEERADATVAELRERVRDLEEKLAAAYEDDHLADQRIERLEAALEGALVGSFRVWSDDLECEVTVTRCDCGARVEVRGRDPRTVTLEHLGDCPLRKPPFCDRCTGVDGHRFSCPALRSQVTLPARMREDGKLEVAVPIRSPWTPDVDGWAVQVIEHEGECRTVFSVGAQHFTIAEDDADDEGRSRCEWTSDAFLRALATRDGMVRDVDGAPAIEDSPNFVPDELRAFAARRFERVNGADWAPARLDADGTAKPKTEIVAVMPTVDDGRIRTLHEGMVTHYLVREAVPEAPVEVPLGPPLQFRSSCAAADLEAAEEVDSPLLQLAHGTGYALPDLPPDWTWQRLDDAIMSAPTVAGQWRAVAVLLTAQMEGLRQQNRELHQGIARRKKAAVETIGSERSRARAEERVGIASGLYERAKRYEANGGSDYRNAAYELRRAAQAIERGEDDWRAR